MPYDEVTANNQTAFTPAPPKPGTIEPDGLARLIRLFIQGRQRQSAVGDNGEPPSLLDFYNKMRQASLQPKNDGPSSSGGSGGNQYII